MYIFDLEKTVSSNQNKLATIWLNLFFQDNYGSLKKKIEYKVIQRTYFARDLLIYLHVIIITGYENVPYVILHSIKLSNTCKWKEWVACEMSWYTIEIPSF